MNVVVNLVDQQTLNATFEPTERNLVLVKDFYVDLYTMDQIRGFVITYDNGEVFAMGEVI